MLSQCLSGLRTALGIVRTETFTQHGTGKMLTRPQQPRRLFSRGKNAVLTIGNAIKHWTSRFTNANIPEPVESIEHIVAHVVHIRKVLKLASMRNQRLTEKQFCKLITLCKLRLARMPVQYIIREWNFRDITLKLVPPIFIPRPETEMLVHYLLEALQFYEGKTLKILDVGCGSGAIALAVAHTSKRVRCVAVDANQYACRLTERNRDRLRLKHCVAIAHAALKDDGFFEILSALNECNELSLNSESFDFIISNPPYIPTKEIATLPLEIKAYEDLTALDGGDDGLKVIKPLLKYAATALKPSGHLLLEVDTTHPEYIQCFIKEHPVLKLKYEHTLKDLCNSDRFVQIKKLP